MSLAKEAEIERLQHEVVYLEEENQEFRALITELADALNYPEAKPWKYREELIQRAREATK